MPTYDVLVERTMQAYVRVEAADEQSAVRAAEVADLPADPDWTVIPKSVEVREDVVEGVVGRL